MAMCFSLRLGMIIWNQQPGSEKNQDQCTVKLVNLPPIPSLPIASVHICYFFCKNNATYLRGIPCLQGNYCISMYFEEVESFLKQWSYKKDKSKAELHYRMFIFPHLCIYIYIYLYIYIYYQILSAFLQEYIVFLIKGNILSLRQIVTCKQHFPLTTVFLFQGMLQCATTIAKWFSERKTALLQKGTLHV